MAIRKFSSTSIDTTLAAGGVSSSTTTMTVASGTGSTLMGGITLTAGDQFTVALDPDTVNEEIVFITAQSVDSFTVTRGRAGTSAVVHAAGATVRHVLTSDDLNFFNTAVQASTLTAKGDMYVATASGVVTNLAAGTNGQILAADSTQTKGLKWIDSIAGYTQPTIGSTAIPSGSTVTTIAGLTLTSPTVNSPSIKSPREVTTVSATAATGTINLDTVTQGTLYYTTSASANWTLNVRGDGSTTLNSLMATGESITVVFLATQGSTAYYASAFTIDGSSITPKWQGGTAPSAGNTSSVDAYSYTIFKTGSATYTVFASQVKFA